MIRWTSRKKDSYKMRSFLEDMAIVGGFSQLRKENIGRWAF